MKEGVGLHVHYGELVLVRHGTECGRLRYIGASLHEDERSHDDGVEEMFHVRNRFLIKRGGQLSQKPSPTLNYEICQKIVVVLKSEELVISRILGKLRIEGDLVGRNHHEVVGIKPAATLLKRADGGVDPSAGLG